eukprot:15279704-Heterocapsa_arctica.AAC.1
MDKAKEQIIPRQESSVREAVDKIEGNIVRNHAWARAADKFKACRKRLRDKEEKNTQAKQAKNT